MEIGEFIQVKTILIHTDYTMVSIDCNVLSDEVTLFTLKIFYGCEFTQLPDRNYLPGDIAYIEFADTNDFGIDVLEEMVKQIGYDVDMVFYYHFKDPNSLDDGLRNLFVDNDFEMT
ncbi:hypothetical protein Hanom_Chr08g00756061 [Helianthus anomalus]